MTIKKILISAVTATLLITTIVGCGDSSSTESDSSTGTASIQTSTQAVDGYIYNAKAQAYYLADDNKTMKSITLKSSDTIKDVATEKVTLGSSTYSLPSDTNSSVKARIKFFKFSKKPSSSVGVLFTAATYVESSGIDGYDKNDTLFTTNLYTPANAKISSPLTSLIYQANKTLLFGSETLNPTTIVDLNETTFKELENNASVIAKNLGLGDINILSADPVALATSHPLYRLVSALMLDAKATAGLSILNASTPARTLVDTLTMVANNLAVGTKAEKLARSLVSQTTSGAFSVEFISKMNIEMSVKNGEIVSLESPSTKGMFPLSKIEVGGVNADEFISSGAKIKNTDFNASITFADNIDKNISTTKFKLVVAVKGDKSFVSQNDSNLSGALVVELPFDLNSTNGTLATSVAAGTLVPYEAKASDGSEVVYKNDINASTLIVDGTNVVTTSGKTVSFDLETLIKNVNNNSADANLTSSNTGLDLTKISSVQAYLVDVDGKIVGTDSTGKNSQPLAKGDLNGITGDIFVAEAIKIINLGDTDLRGIVTSAANKTPNNSLKIDSVLDDNKLSTNTIVINNDANASLQLLASTNDTMEENTTVVFSFAGGITDLNTSGVASQIKSDSKTDTTNVANAIHVATTSTTANVDVNGTLGYKLTDEFGKSVAKTANIRINRKPTAINHVDMNYTIDGNFDINATFNSITGVDVNTSAQTTDGSVVQLGGLITDIVDPDLTDENKTKLTFVAVDDTLHCTIVVDTVLNCTILNDGNFTITTGVDLKTHPDMNLTYIDGNASVIPVEFTIRATDENGLYKESNITINK